MKYYAISETDMKNIANAIRDKKQQTDGMTVSQMSEEIASIETVRYVTFMVGDVEVYRKAVVVGDACPDPVEQGFIETPAKESTAQYEYTFYGWGASNNGAADDTILQGIVKDTTVYAIFAATVKTYTITWLDDDGVTVLKTEQVAYGTKPSYVPKKEGLFCTGWTPAVTIVTTDASYTAVWAEMITILSPTSINVYGYYSGTINLGQSYTFQTGEKYLVTFGTSGAEKSYETTFKGITKLNYSSSYNSNKFCILGNPFEIRSNSGERPTSVQPSTLKDSGEPFAIMLDYNSTSVTVPSWTTSSSLYVKANNGTYMISIYKIAT